MAIERDIRMILATDGKLAVAAETLDAHADLFAAGLDSLAMVNVLMAIEERFNLEVPDRYLSRRTFASIASLAQVVHELQREAA